MNINSLPPHLSSLRGLQDPSRARVEQERAPRAPAAPGATPASPAVDPLTAGRPQATLPAEPPAGTDPELWSVLSSEERVFFARLGTMGPLTYGRLSTETRAENAIPRGGRLDVRA